MQLAESRWKVGILVFLMSENKHWTNAVCQDVGQSLTAIEQILSAANWHNFLWSHSDYADLQQPKIKPNMVVSVTNFGALLFNSSLREIIISYKCARATTTISSNCLICERPNPTTLINLKLIWLMSGEKESQGQNRPLRIPPRSRTTLVFSRVS